ncbi:MAG: hypothetical protein RLZZ283_355 [Candidatus Parcubacteria bacterium]|jgi:nitroimidazol reductase NimA-like FMN-containing flavoprotein (pyridoxamine 5'-phosphate oxidase superfamily)
MENTRNLVQEVLENAYLLVLSTNDSEGVWSAPVVFIHDEQLNLYWISQPTTRHSKALLENPLVAGSIIASFASDDERAVQVSGRAELSGGPSFELIEKFAQKRNEPVPKTPDDVLGFLEGDRWYCLKPDTYKLTHSKHFGYENVFLKL